MNDAAEDEDDTSDDWSPDSTYTFDLAGDPDIAEPTITVRLTAIGRTVWYHVTPGRHARSRNPEPYPDLDTPTVAEAIDHVLAMAAWYRIPLTRTEADVLHELDVHFII